MRHSFVVSAPAKLNLSLRVTGKREDGRHSLLSEILFLNLHDALEVSPSDEGEDLLSVEGPFATASGPIHENIVLKALHSARLAGIKVGPCKLRLIKNIPVGAGLGGGSCDAAALLKGLLRSYRPGTTVSGRVRTYADALGADVTCALLSPSFVTAGGAGELTKEAPLPRRLTGAQILLLCPKVHVATKEVFSAYARACAPRSVTPKQEVRMFARFSAATLGQGSALKRVARNDLRAVTEALYPEVAEAGAFLAATRGTISYGMSGSGGCCFAIYSSRKCVESALTEARERFPEAFSVCVLPLRKV